MQVADFGIAVFKELSVILCGYSSKSQIWNTQIDIAWIDNYCRRCFDGTNVFYVEKNAGGFRTAIRKVSADGTDPIVYSHGVDNLRYYNGYMYFLDGDDLYKMSTKNYVVDNPVLLREGNVHAFEITDGAIYLREKFTIKRSISKYKNCHWRKRCSFNRRY